ncbi:hypothetical protein DL96DRAFT_1605168 [Flagelloscypha sp. PMI_526]|nr:hypothetical protein DL96DRAFT_1605168 [Flagelloscypha sp. PMI_526]
MTNKEDEVTNIRRIGLGFIGELKDGTPVIRGGKDSIWKLADTSVPPQASTTGSYTLRVTREHEVPGEPTHWSLFLGDSESIRGNMWQVRGDSETGMELGDWVVASGISQDQIDFWFKAVDEATKAVAPPKNVRDRNCQNWTVDVLRVLVGLGMVSSAVVEDISRNIGEKTRTEALVTGSSFVQIMEESFPGLLASASDKP